MIIGKFKDEVITSEMLKIKYKNIDLRLDNLVKSCYSPEDNPSAMRD